MASLFLTALIVLTAAAALGVLADSGLRWWSAFGRLRAEMRGSRAAALPARRVQAAQAGFARAVPVRNAARVAISRAAA